MIESWSLRGEPDHEQRARLSPVKVYWLLDLRPEIEVWNSNPNPQHETENINDIKPLRGKISRPEFQIETLFEKISNPVFYEW